MISNPPSDQDIMLPWDAHGGRPAPLQLDFASIWYGDDDWGMMRARHLAQAAMRLQIGKLSEAGEDDGVYRLAGTDDEGVNCP